MKNRHGSSFVISVLEDVQLIPFQWTFSDGCFSHKQGSYFAANPQYFRRLCLDFWGQKFSPTKRAWWIFCLWGLLGWQLWWWLDICESSSCCFSTKSLFPPLPQTYLNKLRCLSSLTCKIHHKRREGSKYQSINLPFNALKVNYVEVWWATWEAEGRNSS